MSYNDPSQPPNWQQPPPPPQYTQYPPYQQPPPQWQQPGLPPQYPMPPQQPPRKGKAPLWVILLVIAIVACAGASALAKTGNNSTATSTDTPTTQAATSTPAPTATPAPTQAPAKWVTTHRYAGNGSKKTGVFAVPGDWKIVWSCDHTSFSGYDYNMIITVYNSDATYADSGVNSTCTKTNTHDETEEHQSGNVYLDITSEGSWTIQIQELK